MKKFSYILLIIIVIFFVSVIVKYRFKHPNLTETQLLLDTLKLKPFMSTVMEIKPPKEKK